MGAMEAARVVAHIDRQAGAALRRRAEATGVRPLAVGASEALAPVFQITVAAMIVVPTTRRAGVEALVSGALAATGAKLMRDRVDRRRPGPRSEGGFPSRHAAAAVAIARSAHRSGGPAGVALGLIALGGLAGRVLSAAHEPADIAGGALMGWASDRIVRWLASSA